VFDVLRLVAAFLIAGFTSTNQLLCVCFAAPLPLIFFSCLAMPVTDVRKMDAFFVVCFVIALLLFLHDAGHFFIIIIFLFMTAARLSLHETMQQLVELPLRVTRKKWPVLQRGRVESQCLALFYALKTFMRIDAAWLITTTFYQL